MVAKRMDGIKMSGIRKMFEKANKDAIHLGLGEPDFPPPPEAIEALVQAAKDGNSRYSSIFGLEPLREEVAKYLKNYKPDITKDDVLVTVGGSEGLMCTAGSLYDPGDEVLMPDPGFVLYAPHARLMGAKPVFYSLTMDNDFQPQQDELQSLVTKKTKAIIVNSPANPTGGVFGEKEVRMIIDLAKENDLVIITDEVYDHVIYEGKHISFLGKYDKVVYVNSFSKTFAMPGWRVGFLTAPKEIFERIATYHYYILACAPNPNQLAVLAALKKGFYYAEKMTKEFKERRKLIVDLLNEIPGFTANMPKGAFYSMPRFEKKVEDTAVAMKILEAGVVCTPGSAFGLHGKSHLRFSYASSKDNIKNGVAKVAEAWKKV